MSWEDCGFKPGPFEPAKCPAGRCGDCDGEHHFYVSSDPDEGEDGNEIVRPPDYEPEMYFVCKHCGCKAALIEEVEAF